MYNGERIITPKILSEPVGMLTLNTLALVDVDSLTIHRRSFDSFLHFLFSHLKSDE